ncbi:ATP-dependent zinc metalloprotease FtsH [Svornostia abyssi]|uniref:ATP-dependent zinc metalloprotease FtsH n=1 Tax=Svornostia abyssi TaxID=2898438 RepID=A0ABY5PM31_9ACTN|nr:ATP-dependent zinc metalloprotease FtsH [Parviterribacteraceae bacterium J379]
MKLSASPRALRTFTVDPISAALAGIVVVLALAFVLLLNSTTPEPVGKETSITDVQTLAKEQRLTEGTILDYDHIILVTTTEGEELWAGLPASGSSNASLQNTFTRAGIPLRYDPQSGKQARRLVVQVLLPVLILVLLFTLLARLTQRGPDDVGRFSRWRKRNVAPPTSPTTFADVAGAPTAVAELQELCDLLREPGRYAVLGARAPRGALLVGPPGTGKTLLARATAGEAGASFFSVSGAEFVESLVGVGAARIRDLFSQARDAAPAIVFIDELDAVGRKRGAGVGQGNDEREQTLNQLLVEIDGFDAGTGIIVLAATNRPDILDPALLRPGRFDRQVTVDAPDIHGRTQILKLYLQGRPVADDVEPASIAALCPGYTGAELENVVNEASLLAARGRREAVSEADLEEAIERVLNGPRATAHRLTPNELRSIATHEASHAVVARALGGDGTRRLSIVARGRRLGAAAIVHADRERLVLRESDLARQLATTMAGTAGERLAFGELSTAVHDDLHAATALARSMVTSYGMSDLGPITIGERSTEVFLGASLQELGGVGQTTLDTIDAQTRRIVERAEEIATHALREHWPVVQEIASRLAQRETLSEDELADLLAPIPIPILAET